MKVLGLALLLLATPRIAEAQSVAPAATASAAPAAAAAPAADAPVATASAAAPASHFAIAPGGYTPMKPTAGKGMPVDAGIGFQTQYSPNGQYALWMHNAILLPVIIAVCIFVLALLIWVVIRYNSRANPVASRTSHNTLLEVIWTGVPILILLVVFVPSMKLLAKQYKALPADALTVKATGNQWYWSYTYPDNGGFEVISNILPAGEAT